MQEERSMVLADRAASAIYYGTTARDQQTIRVEAVLKDRIDGDLFQQSVDEGMQRYPYLLLKVGIRQEAYVHLKNDRPVMVHSSADLPVLGSDAVHGHLLAWGYEDRTVYLDVSHGILDGMSMMPVLATVLYLYCQKRYDEDLSSAGIQLPGEKIKPEEWQETLTDTWLRAAEKKELPKEDGDPYALPEIWTGQPTRHALLLPRKAFLSYVKRHGGTPGVVMTALFSEAVRQVSSGLDGQHPIVTTVYVNSRPMLDRQTASGCMVTSVDLSFTSAMQQQSVEERIPAYRRQQRSLVTRENIQEKVSQQVRTYHRNQQISTLQEKLRQLGRTDLVFRVGTFSVSSTGKDAFGAVSPYIEELHSVVTPTTYLIEMNCTGPYFTVDFLQSFPSSRYVDALVYLLEARSLPYRRLLPVPLRTAKVVYAAERK